MALQRKHKFIIGFFIFLQQIAFAATLRDNTLEFHTPKFSQVQPMQYVYMVINNPDSFSVTSRQPFSNKIYGCGGPGDLSDRCLLIKSGRKKSAEVANWVKATLGGDPLNPANETTSVAGSGVNGFPNQLNFAVEGTLYFDTGGSNRKIYSCPNIIIAQGSIIEVAVSVPYNLNNWWIFSNMSNSAVPSTPGQEYTLINCSTQSSTGDTDASDNIIMQIIYGQKLDSNFIALGNQFVYQIVPSGSYIQSCNNINYPDGNSSSGLSAMCLNNAAQFIASKLDYSTCNGKTVANNGGVLKCNL
jgi:hypothetical protein